MSLDGEARYKRFIEPIIRQMVRDALAKMNRSRPTTFVITQRKTYGDGTVSGKLWHPIAVWWN